MGRVIVYKVRDNSLFGRLISLWTWEYFNHLAIEFCGYPFYTGDTMCEMAPSGFVSTTTEQYNLERYAVAEFNTPILRANAWVMSAMLVDYDWLSIVLWPIRKWIPNRTGSRWTCIELVHDFLVSCTSVKPPSLDLTPEQYGNELKKQIDKLKDGG